MSIELRQVHVDALIELGEKHNNLRVLEADLAGAAATGKFAVRFPGQFIQCGIAEANMIGVAAGLAAVGYVPFVHSFGCFVTRRCYDQLFLSAGYARLHLNIFGSDAGVSAVTNGGTHMPFEDTGLMRLVPGARVIDISDRHVLKKAIDYSFYHPGVNYIRSTRKGLPELYQSTDDVVIGRGNVLRDGTDLTIVASGLSVHDVLAAARELEQKTGKTIAVIDMHTIKPLDTELLVNYVRKTGKLMTVENHNVIGGLGDAVISSLAEVGVMPSSFKKLGVKEQFGQVGDLEFLKSVYGISAEHIMAEAEKLLTSAD